MVCSHARDGGEHDGGHGRCDGHFDAQVCAHIVQANEEGEKRHHDHAATYAQEAS